MTIEEIRKQLDQGLATSKEIVLRYLERIARYDGNLNSLADLNHEALFIAEALDEERRTKGPRGPLHGVPILIKDNILTRDTMRTTANSHVFRGFYAGEDAHLVTRLRDAGAILLAKANCSEFAYFMAMGTMPSGYGSMHGQVKHPYDDTIDPLGSSTGSAVAVAADLAPASIGTETNGSLMSPAQQNGVVSIKPTVGLVSRRGIIPISLSQDTAGPMTKTVKDAALLLQGIVGADPEDIATARVPDWSVDYLAACDADVAGMRVGLLNFTNHENTDEEKAILDEASRALKKAGVKSVSIDHLYDLPNNLLTLIHDFKRNMNAFLAHTVNAPVKTLKGIIDENNINARRNLKYGQKHLLQAEATDERLTDETYLNQRFKEIAAVNAFLTLFETHGVDAIVTPKVNGYAAVGGLPSLIVPAKKMTDKNPKGLLFIGKAFAEKTLFALARRYERETNHRSSPDLP